MSQENEPRAPWQPTAMDESAESVIQSLEAEQAAATVAAEPAPEPELGTEAPPEVPVVEAEAKPEDRGIERLVAREVELRTKEAGIDAKLAKVTEYEARIKELESRQMPDDLAFNLRTNPTEALEAMGISSDDLVRRVIAARLGDQVPEKLKEELHRDETQRQIHELQKQINQRDQAAAARAFVDQVNAGAREYVTKGVGEHAPTVSRVAKANPERVYQEILAEISADARARSAREPNGAVLPYEEAAKRVEARWAELASTLTPASTTAPATTALGAKNGTPQPTIPVVKPPERPLAPWLQAKDAQEDAGLKAAIAEYRRLEGVKTR
mgnify:CR=1 FL=1